jgi:hypothetical protein
LTARRSDRTIGYSKTVHVRFRRHVNGRTVASAMGTADAQHFAHSCWLPVHAQRNAEVVQLSSAAAFGLNIADLGSERGHISLPHTHLSGLPRAQSDPRVVAAPQLPLKLPLQQTNLVHRMFQGLGEMPFFLLQQAGPQEVPMGMLGPTITRLIPSFAQAPSCRSIRSKTK